MYIWLDLLSSFVINWYNHTTSSVDDAVMLAICHGSFFANTVFRFDLKKSIFFMKIYFERPLCFKREKILNFEQKKTKNVNKLKIWLISADDGEIFFKCTHLKLKFVLRHTEKNCCKQRAVTHPIATMIENLMEWKWQKSQNNNNGFKLRRDVCWCSHICSLRLWGIETVECAEVVSMDESEIVRVMIVKKCVL